MQVQQHHLCISSVFTAIYRLNRSLPSQPSAVPPWVGNWLAYIIIIQWDWCYIKQPMAVSNLPDVDVAAMLSRLTTCQGKNPAIKTVSHVDLYIIKPLTAHEYRGSVMICHSHGLIQIIINNSRHNNGGSGHCRAVILGDSRHHEPTAVPASPTSMDSFTCIHSWPESLFSKTRFLWTRFVNVLRGTLRVFRRVPLQEPAILWWRCYSGPSGLVVYRALRLCAGMRGHLSACLCHTIRVTGLYYTCVNTIGWHATPLTHPSLHSPSPTNNGHGHINGITLRDKGRPF